MPKLQILQTCMRRAIIGLVVLDGNVTPRAITKYSIASSLFSKEAKEFSPYSLKVTFARGLNVVIRPGGRVLSPLSE